MGKRREVRIAMLPQAWPARPTVDVLAVAVWFGLLAGLVEGGLYLAMLGRGGPLDVSVELLWGAPLVDLVLFILLGLVLAALGKVPPGRRMAVVAVGLCAFLTFVDWLAIVSADRLHYLAVLALAAGLAAELARQFRRREAAGMAFCRRSLPVLAAVTLFVLVAVQGGGWLRERQATRRLPVAPPDSPSILLIVADTLRADHLASYGYTRPTSPAIDQLAREGVLFENAISTASWSLPAHASLFTGQLTHEHGVDWAQPLALIDSPYPTLAETLTARGYRTAAFSANLEWVTRSLGFGRGFVHFEDFFQSPQDMILRSFFGRTLEQLVLQRLGYDDLPARRRAEDIRAAASRWLEQDRGKPFFMFLNFMDTHDPYLPPQPYRSMFSSVPEPGGALNRRVGRGDMRLTPQQLQGELDAYDGAVAYVDSQIGQLLAEMKARGLDEHLLVVITSDHGEAFAEHRTFIHGNSLYREEIHVPLVFRLPGQVPQSARIAQPVSFASIPATIMELAGANPNPFGRFPSLAALWRTPAVASSWPAPLAEESQIPWVSEEAPAHYGALKSMVSQRWHFIMHQTLGAALYDWSRDRREQQNLVSSPGLAQTLSELQAALVRAVMGGAPTPTPQSQ